MAYTFKHGERPLPGYTIQRAVGRGGFGEVYYALADSGKQVALKYLRENAEVELRGIAHVMNLKSPHLITIYDVKKNDEGDPFVVMEYISGPSLHDLLVAEPDGLGVQKTAFFFKGIVEGLSYLHERGIVHRDMKPGNIFFDDGYVKIGDYGLSKHMSVSRHSGQTASVGTVHYMAPEIGSGNYSKAIDIYALGVMLYEMLTGRIPFSGSSMGEILMRHLSDQPDVSGIPEPFASVIAKALAKDPKDRYQDVNEMLDAVISQVDIRDSIGSFDPNTLTSVPRVDSVAEPTRTHSPVPPLPPIPALDARSVFDPETLTPRLRKKAQKLQRKLDKKKAKYQARLAGKLGARERHREGQPAPGDPAPAAAVATPVAAAPAPVAVSSAAVNRKGQLLLLVAVTVGVSMGMAMLVNRGDFPVRVISLALQIAGATIGALIAYFGMIRRSLTPGGFMNRAGMAALAALFMVPGAIVATEELRGSDFNVLFFPIIAMILFCDWSGRIELGRRGHVEAGDAFWPAVIGLIVGAMFDAPALIAAGVCATVSLLTQSAAAMWSPVPAGGQSPTRRRDQRGADKLKHIGSELSDAANEMAREIRQVANNVTDGIQKTIRGRRANTVDGAVIAVSRHPIWRGIWGALSTMALITSVGCFFVLVLTDIHGSDERAALLFGTLAGVASLPFFLKKAFQKNRQPIWRGTLRFLCISMGLNLAAGMIAVISFGVAKGEALGVAIFGLVAGGIVALVSVCIPGPKHLAAASQASAAPEPPEPQPRPMEVVHGATPSFVGRTANAGLSFLGKLFLLTGLFCAICYNLESPTFEFGAGKSLQYVSGSIEFQGMGIDKPKPVPPAIVLAPLVLGSIFLVLARRHDGGAHVLRGFTGCALGIVAAVFALGPAKEGIPVFLTDQNWSRLSDGDLAGQVIATGAILALSLAFLFWPKPGHPRKIVV